jgi:hypothetical protein
MKRYRKAIVAAVGVMALVSLRYFEIEIPGIDAVILDLIVGAFVSLGVYQVRNEA